MDLCRGDGSLFVIFFEIIFILGAMIQAPEKYIPGTPCQGVWWISAGVMAASIADSLLPHDSDSPPGFHIVPMLHVSSSFQWTNPLIWGSLGESMGLLFGYASSSTFHPCRSVASLLYLIECLGRARNGQIG